MPRVRVNGIELYYEVHGAGETLVCLNGLTADTSSWAQQLPAFTARHRVVLYDCRGQGRSDKPEAEYYPTEEHAEDLKVLLEVLGVERAHLVGFSQGGAVAQQVAIRFPERVNCLVLADTFSQAGLLLQATLRAWEAALRMGGPGLRFDVGLPLVFGERFLAENHEALAGFREMCLRLPAGVVMRLSEGSRRHNVTADLPRIQAPTLVVVGAEDILTPVRYARTLHRGITGSELVILPDCGHASPIERPAEFNRAVLQFLARRAWWGEREGSGVAPEELEGWSLPPGLV